MHKPLHCRATLSQPFQHIGLAIDPSMPVLNLASERLRGPDTVKPKLTPAPVTNPIRDIAVFFAQLNAVAQLMLEALAPVTAVFQLFQSVYNAEKKRLSARQPARDSWD